jgi:hypothetical protein
MGQRLDLHVVLEAICPNVYFQPPANVQLEYPAIVYERDRSDTQFADDIPYSVTKQYSMTLISRDPDEAIFELLSKLPMCAHERHFATDSLNHDVFSIYF